MKIHLQSDFATKKNRSRRGEAKGRAKQRKGKDRMENEEFAYPYGGALYRTPGEIRSDIRRIAEQIREADRKLNIRDMIVETLCAEGGNPKKLILSLEALLEESHAALDTLGELEEKLDGLRAELEESRCRIRL